MRIIMTCSFISAVFLVSGIQAVTLPFVDNFESGLSAWGTNGQWGLTDSLSKSPSHAAVDSPNTLYANNNDSALTLASGFNLSGVSNAVLRFYQIFELEEDYDFGQIEISTNGGVAWFASPASVVTGNQPFWRREQLELSAFFGSTDVRLRFRLTTDESVVMDGWALDDVRVAAAPAMPVLLPVTNNGPNQVLLSWTPSAGPDLAGYRIFRSTGPGVDWHTAHQVADLPPSATNYTDISVTPKSTFYYRIMAIDANDIHAMSNEGQGVTPAGMDYPFIDNGEGGASTWVPEGTWALSTEAAWSGSHSWSDSPGTNYENQINRSLRLATPVSLVGRLCPTLSFVHNYSLLAGDIAAVEVSVNGGNDWTSLAQYTAGNSGGWQRQQCSLAAYTNASALLIRFRVSTDPSGQADGWHLDDISLADLPDTVTGVYLDDVLSHSLRINWTVNTNQIFSHYAVYRSDVPGVTFNATLVTNVYSTSTTHVIDSSLLLDTVYYYQVFAVSPYGTLSSNSTEVSARTLNNPIPFVDTFEASASGWILDGAWGITTNRAFSGTHALADSPNGGYADSSDSSARTALDLRNTTWPVLRFQDTFKILPGDWGILEVSPDGGTWYRLYEAQGISTNWTRRSVDLSPWRNQGNLRIRFRLTSDGSNADDGWFVDDVSVVEHTAIPVDYPFQDGFENGLTNWIASTWSSVTNTPYAGSGTVLDTGAGQRPSNLEVIYALNLGGTLSLTSAVNPQVTFWSRIPILSACNFKLEASTDNGLNWADISGDIPASAGWVRRQYSLNAYVGQIIRLRFRAYQGYWWGAGNSEVYLDNLVVQDMPPTVTLSAVPQLKSVNLSWTASTLGAGFRRYDIYRATHADVTLGDTLIGSFTDINSTNMVSDGLTIGASYYYRVYTVNTNDTFVASNERQVTTVPIVFPLTDAMETLGNWYVTGFWGVGSGLGLGGSNCLTDTPGDFYGNDQDSYAMTAVSLIGSTWPVLRFQDRGRILPGDWGALEVSPDGGTWYRLYEAQGISTNWTGRSMDLSPWRNQANLRIRFRLTSDGSNGEDGWFVDNVSVVEHTAIAVDYPFQEGFENGVTNWIASTWSSVTNTPYAGSGTVLDTGAGQRPGNLEVIYALTLGGTLSLTSAVNPQVTFWSRLPILSACNFKFEVSTDNGLNWADVSGDIPASANWVRRQYSLNAYVGQIIRLRFRTYQGYWWGAGNSDIYLDNLVVQDMPPSVTLSASPQLKSVNLSWTASTLGGGFRRYEVYRATHAGVTIGDTMIGSFTDINSTNMVSDGLTIGATYYYRVFTVNTSDSYVASNERQVTTVPIAFPLTDATETLDNWYVTGFWGVGSGLGLGGTNCLTDTPGDFYGNDQDSYAMTAVSLIGSVWPVLRFQDRGHILPGDWGALEVSPDGGTWFRLYEAQGINTNWTGRSVDLSPWRNQGNLRIRFRLTSDGSNADDGWFVDDVSVVEHTAIPVNYPFQEGFENGLTNWIASTWSSVTNTPYAGNESVLDTGAGQRPANLEVIYALNLGGTLSLTSAVNPQVTFWSRLPILSACNFKLEASTDNGLNWADVSGDIPASAGWVRRQYSLNAYAGQNIRLRFRTYQGYWWRAGNSEVYLDNLVVQDMPPAVTLSASPQLKTVNLEWTASSLGADFRRYEVYRANHVAVTIGDTLIGSFADINSTNMVSEGLMIGATYYYRVFSVNTNDTYVASNERQVTTVPIALPLADAMETPGNWYVTGSWGVGSGLGVGGTNCLTDSAVGDYDNNQDTYAMTSVNLIGSTWPVLRFKDSFRINVGDWGAFEVSPDDGTWYRLYEAQGIRTNWTERSVDLSPWRNQGNLRLRFRLTSDPNNTDAGWLIDDVSVAEHNQGVIAYPLFDNFEHGLTNWIASTWSSVTNTPYAGNESVLDTGAGQRPGNLEVIYALNLGGSLSLTGAVNPQVTFWSRIPVLSACNFKLEASVDNGLTWGDLAGDIPASADWVKRQYSLNAYVGQTVRLRFRTYQGYWWGAGNSDIYLDNIGVGDPAPGKPIRLAPADFESVNSTAPSFIIRNASDYQGDALTYEFQVYDDETLTNSVASVPAYASGVSNTTWTVDLELANNRQYWWRCRASDSVNTGAWMEPCTFFVNKTNAPPSVTRIAGPPPASILPNLASLLSWYPSVDTDVGDSVAAYHVQVANNPVFTNPAINDSTLQASPAPTGDLWSISMPLVDMVGSGNLSNNITYFWRVRAIDGHAESSAWSTGMWWFIYGTPPPNVVGMHMDGGDVSFEWERSGKPVYIEYSPSLAPADWMPIEGPIYGTNYTLTLPENTPQGFFRVQTE